MTPLIVAQPRGAHAHRPRLVVDASVLAAVLYAEPDLEHALIWMSGRALCAPHLVDYELANVALNKVKRRAATLASESATLEALGSLDLARHAVEPGAVFALAAQYGLTAYDAAYLWLAEHLAAPLATLDAALGAAAQRHLGSATD